MLLPHDAPVLSLMHDGQLNASISEQRAHQPSWANAVQICFTLLLVQHLLSWRCMWVQCTSTMSQLCEPTVTVYQRAVLTHLCIRCQMVLPLLFYTYYDNHLHGAYLHSHPGATTFNLLHTDRRFSMACKEIAGNMTVLPQMPCIAGQSVAYSGLPMVSMRQRQPNTSNILSCSANQHWDDCPIACNNFEPHEALTAQTALKQDLVSTTTI